MRILLGLIRAILILGGFIALAVVVGVVMIVGGVYMLLTGRRPQVKVFRPQGFGGFSTGEFGRMDQDAFFRSGDEAFGRPPMKDVTPQTAGTLPGQN